MDDTISEMVDKTPFIDTHEHLVEESYRLAGKLDAALFPADDWTSVFIQYLSDDFYSAGMPAVDAKHFFGLDLGAEEKYRLIEPYWKRVRHTGYAHSLRETLRGLYGEDDLTAESAPRIAEKYRSILRPEFYRKIIRDRANIEECHVNSLERIFMASAQPELLAQDLSFLEFACCGPNDIAVVEGETGASIKTLDDWLGVSMLILRSMVRTPSQ